MLALGPKASLGDKRIWAVLLTLHIPPPGKHLDLSGCEGT